MARTFIYCAVIVIIGCTQLQSVHSRDYRREVDPGLKRLRHDFVKDIALLENLGRPIIITQKAIKSERDGSESCTGVLSERPAKTSSYKGLDMQCNGWLDRCVDFDQKNTENPTPAGEYCKFEDQLIWAKESKSTSPVEYGVKDDCGGNPISKIVHTSGKDYDICMCQCTDDSENYELNVNWGISLEPAVADVNFDKIVEGVRIRTNHKMIYLEIKEKSLGCSEDGVWKSPGRKNKLIRNQHYSALIPDDRTLQINEIEMPPGYVVTGVRFRKILADPHNGKGIVRLEALGTMLDEETGGLISSTSVWFDTEGLPTMDTFAGRIAIPVEGGRNLKKNITFRSRQNMHRNLGLLTVPYLDLSDVAEGKPLTAIGLSCQNCGTDEEYLVPTISPMEMKEPRNMTTQQRPRIPIINYQFVQQKSAGAQNSPGFFVAFVSLATIIIFYEIRRI